MLCDNVALWGDPNVVVTSDDPSAFAGLPGFFDVIVADVPCSGEGMFRKSPAIMKNWEQYGVEYYHKLQLDILDAVIPMLAPGGMMVYSTCTFAPAEDEGVKKNNGNDKNGGNTKDAVSGSGLSGLSRQIKNKTALAEELGIGEITLTDIIKELEKPGRDPREEMPKPILRTDVLEMKDLTEGMILKGTVRNVIDFGAFVDIGVHQDGLVHISQMSKERFIKHPLDAVSVGDIVDVKVMSVDLQKKRISLTMKGVK